MSDEKTSTIHTSDLNLSAFLWTFEDSSLDDVYINDFGKVFFNFSMKMSQPELDKLVIDYEDFKLTVEPIKYSYKRAQIRRRMRSAQNAQRQKENRNA
jgi:hypothetical protein